MASASSYLDELIQEYKECSSRCETLRRLIMYERERLDRVESGRRGRLEGIRRETSEKERKYAAKFLASAMGITVEEAARRMYGNTGDTGTGTVGP